MAEPTGPNLHEDRALFREAVNFTASRTGFIPRLIEKDYFCTVLLAYLAGQGGNQVVFKGGTCLAKVHAGFYRLSEDLDFAAPMPVEATRTQRRRAVAATKAAVARVADHLSAFTMVEPLKGANNSTQYNGAVAYESPTTGQPERISIEVGAREPLLMSPVRAKAKTLLLDPIGGEAMVADVPVVCIAMQEAMAEKFRAALSRREAAIRDLYDLDYAVRHLDLDPSDPRLIDMVRRKLTVPGNSPVDVSRERLADLKRQLDARLRTVLRDKEFQAFDLDRAFKLVASMAERLD
jgi:predicted nucleotidyltransferase component of viral defense system